MPGSDVVIHNGNKNLVECLKISTLSTFMGVPMHIHATGLRGIGKTTIARSFKSILPLIEVIKGCSFNCDPMNPVCPAHRNLSSEQIKEIGTEIIPMPFMEISHSAKPGTVVGSVDIAKLINREDPQAALLLGTIPRANRGIVFIDEINRLADTSPQITDILLDVIGTKPGRIQIEETGLKSIELPVSISIWAASNPDEEPGHLKDIRKQLSDRFDFEVNVKRPEEIEEIKEIICSPSAYSLEEVKKAVLSTCKEESFESQVPDDIYVLMACLYKDFNIESIRPIKSIIQGAKILSTLEGRERVSKEDIIRIIEYISNIEGDIKEKILSKLHDDQDKGKDSSQRGQDNLPKGLVSKWTEIARKNIKSKRIADTPEMENAKPIWELHRKNWVVTGKEINRVE